MYVTPKIGIDICNTNEIMHNPEENKEQYQRKILINIKEINALHQRNSVYYEAAWKKDA
jgi:hypothetical protein